MEVICLQDEALEYLIVEVADRIKEKRSIKEDRWVSPERAMEILNIKSKTTLQKMRDEGSITYTQPQKKIILYDYFSIMEYLDKSSKKSF